MSRLYVESNPTKALDYAQKATKLGDGQAEAIQAEILDTRDISNPTHVSASRLMIASQLLARLDPVFSQNVRDSEILRDLGFIHVITGYNILH